MSKIETGGPAFPCHADINPQRDADFAGMTLRDYFAAKAMQGMLADVGLIIEANGLDWHKRTAQSAYAVADAMLKEREASNA